VIGITKQCLSNKNKLRKPKIAETLALPGDILLLDDLTNVLNKETWIEHLTPAERSELCALLPDLEEPDKTSIVESLFNGENLNFGNPAMKWGESVCKGEQRPDALLQKEEELRRSQSQYYKDLKTYRDTLLDSLEELKQLCESCNGEHAKIQEEIEQWRVKKLRDQRA
jgi:hypothetical protein